MNTYQELTADVLVVGSGTAGSLAALAAADEGADVLLLERDFASGGTGTRGGIHSYYHGSRGGFQEMLDAEIKVLEKQFGIRGGSFHPEAKRVSLARLLEARGVRVLMTTLARMRSRPSPSAARTAAMVSPSISTPQAMVW